MKYVKEYGILLLKFLGFLVGGSIVVSVLYYFLVSSKVVRILSIVYLLLLFFVFGFIAGKKTESKGFMAGLKTGGIFVLVLFLLNIIFTVFQFRMVSFLYYLILLTISVLGAMFGINTKKE